MTADQTLVPDSRTDIDLPLLMKFLGARLGHDLAVAAAAGHGFGHLPLSSDSDWTKLDLGDNVRPSYDLQFIRERNPERSFTDTAILTELVTRAFAAGDLDTLLLIATTWSDHADYQAAWATRAPHPRDTYDQASALYHQQSPIKTTTQDLTHALTENRA